MKWKKLTILAITALALAATLIVQLAGCGSSDSVPPSSSTALLSEATMCRSFDSNTGPQNKTDVFSNNNWIICSVKISDAPSGTRVKAAWFYQNKELGYSETLGAQGTQYLGFKIEPKNIKRVRFDPGDYSVKISLNGEEKITLLFKVQ